MTSDAASTFAYSSQNLLISASGAKTGTLSYDPMGRLSQVTSAGATTKFLYDGPDVIEERDGAGNVLRRFIHGDGIDEPLVWYEGSGTADCRYLHADEGGSIAGIDIGGSAKIVDPARQPILFLCA